MRANSCAVRRRYDNATGNRIHHSTLWNQPLCDESIKRGAITENSETGSAVDVGYAGGVSVHYIHSTDIHGSGISSTLVLGDSYGL